MPAELSKEKSLVRKTSLTIDGRRIIAHLYANHIELRAEGKRERVTITWDECLKLGRKVTWVQRGK